MILRVIYLYFDIIQTQSTDMYTENFHSDLTLEGIGHGDLISVYSKSGSILLLPVEKWL